jgi:2,3-bisphosphoglycerate-independent phosphoglycerate mutase
MQRLAHYEGVPGPVVIIVLDGVGIAKTSLGSAFDDARKPTFDRLFAKVLYRPSAPDTGQRRTPRRSRRPTAAQYPHIQLRAHGTAVGMPSDDDMGNSEARARLARQAGQRAESYCCRPLRLATTPSARARSTRRARRSSPTRSGCVLAPCCVRGASAKCRPAVLPLQEGTIWQRDAWREIVAGALAGRSCIHFVGLFSDGNVHSHLDHLRAMVMRAKEEGVRAVRIHALLDGRDVPETSALEYVVPFEQWLAEISQGGFDAQIASGGGRMNITMDRYEANWKMVPPGCAHAPSVTRAGGRRSKRAGMCTSSGAATSSRPRRPPSTSCVSGTRAPSIR